MVNNKMTKREKHGWLTNKKRMQRREQAQTLTDKQVLHMIEKIDSLKKYSKLDSTTDKMLRLRDKALVAAMWIWFKRGNEILRIKLGEIYYDEQELVVTLRIQKKSKRLKICPECKTKNGYKSLYCKKCGISLSETQPTIIGIKAKPVTKRKSVDYPFCKYIIEWLDVLTTKDLEPTAWIFSRYNYFARAFQYNSESPLTVQRLDQILQKLDFTMTSSMFRYGGAEKYLRLGYTPFELKEIGDWSSSKMPEIYADRKGLTPSQKKFTDDIRMV